MEKKTSAANKLVLKQILAQEGNNRCADCKTAQYPRWASWNIGILICIRCSGIHRSLGTHISKVRSIDLDTWNDQQLEKLKVTGNDAANAYWEARLPPHYVPDESKLVNFIKTKYELKRWVSDVEKPAVPPKVRQTRPEAAHANTQHIRTPHAPASRAAPTTHTSHATAQGSPASIDLLGLRAPPAKAQPAPTAPPAAAPAPRPAVPTAQADVKSSILSLYARPGQTPAARPLPAYTTPPTGSTSSLSSLSNLGSVSSLSSINTTNSTSSRREPQTGTGVDTAEEDNFASVWR